jgi:hypothetical protein
VVDCTYLVSRNSNVAGSNPVTSSIKKTSNEVFFIL